MAVVMLDRDGVINEHRHYVHGPDDFYFYPDAMMSIRRLNEKGIRVFIATNQGGVGLGHLSLADVDATHRYMKERLQESGAHIDDIAVCPHAPHAGCDCRKPNPGLLCSLMEEHGFAPSTAFMVGDRATDIEAGRRAGTKTVLINRYNRPDTGDTKPDYSAVSLSDAVDWILSAVDLP